MYQLSICMTDVTDMTDSLDFKLIKTISKISVTTLSLGLSHLNTSRALLYFCLVERLVLIFTSCNKSQV